ncbi:MAG: hypothetical protein R6X02_25180 [Enhygromyxa sp.]
MRRVWAVSLLALALACAKPSPSGVALDRSIREPSGVAASPSHPGVFWVHGDSGTGNWLFAVDGEGKLLARLRVKGAQNIDWEDITVDERGNLWLGDIGNNDSGRRDLVVYRLAEPDPHAGLDEVRVDLSVRFSYPEQTRFGDKLADFDAESLLWWDGQLWLLTKHRSDDLTHLYRFPSLDGQAVELERVATFDLGASLESSERKPWTGQATAAEVAPDGRHWALLSYDAVFVFELPTPGEGAALFARQINRINFDQGHVEKVEALTWDGAQLLIINEDRHVFRIADPLTATRFP